MVTRRDVFAGQELEQGQGRLPAPRACRLTSAFASRYGPRDHRRQRYWCTPANGDPPHRFVEPLPREESWHDACEFCERDVESYEGPHAARKYQFVARGIAEALVMVGSGSTYRAAALVSRERAKRLRADPDSGEPHFSRHGSLVMDWVEVFAPVVFEHYRPRAWPETGSLLLDDLPFRVRNPHTGRTLVAFRVFAALGYEQGRPKLWRLQTFMSKSQVDWEAFMDALPGAPERVVCDNDDGLTSAVRARFPDAELYLCEWHLRHALERLMVNLRREQPEHRAALDELLAGTEAAFAGPSFWLPFTDRCYAAGIPRVSEWLDSTGKLVAEQFGRRGWKRPADKSLSTSPLEAVLGPIRDSIKPRAYGLKNRQRTDRMLMLTQLHANRQDDVHTYIRHIRAWLEANHGRPTIARRAVVDSRGRASLR